MPVDILGDRAGRRPLCGPRRALLPSIAAALEALGRSYEIIFVLDGPREKFAAGPQAPGGRRGDFTVVGLTRSFGEATALMAGFEQAVRASHTSPCPPTTRSTQLSYRNWSAPLATLTSPSPAAGRGPAGPSSACARSAFHGLLGSVTGLDSATSAAAPAPAIARSWRKSSSTATSTASCRSWPTARASGFAKSTCGSRRGTTMGAVYEPRVYARGFLDISRSSSWSVHQEAAAVFRHDRHRVVGSRCLGLDRCLRQRFSSNRLWRIGRHCC